MRFRLLCWRPHAPFNQEDLVVFARFEPSRRLFEAVAANFVMFAAALVTIFRSDVLVAPSFVMIFPAFVVFEPAFDVFAAKDVVFPENFDVIFRKIGSRKTLSIQSVGDLVRRAS